MIFHHTDYKSHDPKSNTRFDSWLCKKLPAGTRLRVEFNISSAYNRAPVSGTLDYRRLGDDLFPYLVNDDGTWQPIMMRDNVEEDNV